MAILFLLTRGLTLANDPPSACGNLLELRTQSQLASCVILLSNNEVERERVLLELTNTGQLYFSLTLLEHIFQQHQLKQNSLASLKVIQKTADLLSSYGEYTRALTVLNDLENQLNQATVASSELRMLRRQTFISRMLNHLALDQVEDAKRIMTQAKQAITSANNKHERLMMMIIESEIALVDEDYLGALEIIVDAKKLFKSDEILPKHLINQLLKVYSANQLFDDAIMLAVDGLAFAKMQDDLRQQTHLLFWLGNTNYSLNYYDSATVFYSEYLKKFNQLITHLPNEQITPFQQANKVKDNLLVIELLSQSKDFKEEKEKQRYIFLGILSVLFNIITLMFFKLRKHKRNLKALQETQAN